MAGSVNDASLFDGAAERPLAERLRPDSIGGIVGQDHLLAPDKPIGRLVAAGRMTSMILWGPAGTGKTTLASILARQSGMVFVRLSAVMSGLPELRKILDAAADRRRGSGRNTVLFVDEIHHWRTNQQDALLPYVEDGTIILIGATTENVGFEVRDALLSRAPVYRLNRLTPEALERLAQRAEDDAGRLLPLTGDARLLLAEMADGDGRYLLTMCADLFDLPGGHEQLGCDGLLAVVQRRAVAHDKSGDAHHALLSALQKSVRGSDPHSSLYWLARLLKAGEPPKAIFRRLAVMATEEIGLSDPQAIIHTASCAAIFERIGEPEGLPALAQCVAYLATAVKSNAVYSAFHAAMDIAERTGALPPPKHLINASNRTMRDQGFKAGYVYDHDCEHAFSGQEFMPEGLGGPARPTLYAPNERGNEREIGKRMRFWNSLREKLRAAR